MMNLTSLINRPQVLNFFDTPTFQRHAFGSLIVTNGILRPTATMLDSKASEKERHYSAAREMFHQTMCLISHYSLAANFEKAAFWLAQKNPMLRKEFGEYQTFQQVKAARQFNLEARRSNRLVEAGLKKGLPQAYKEIPAVLTGVLRLGDSMGTILALCCVAPLINNYLLGPVLGFLKLGPSPNKAPAKPEQPPQFKGMPRDSAQQANPFAPPIQNYPTANNPFNAGGVPTPSPFQSAFQGNLPAISPRVYAGSV